MDGSDAYTTPLETSRWGSSFLDSAGRRGQRARRVGCDGVEDGDCGGGDVARLVGHRNQPRASSGLADQSYRDRL